MASMYDFQPKEVIDKTSEELKKELPMPEWTKYVKTGPSKQRHPAQPDWYYHRAASVLRKIYMYGPIGVNKLRVKYGSKKDRGHKPELFLRASGKIIRTILQQLETKGFIKQEAKGVHKGRVVTPKGKKLLDTVVRKKDGFRRVQKENNPGNAEAGTKASRSTKTN